MRLQKLILTNFKNYASQQIDCSAKLNCFVGKNGMGKTNLLDSIYYLCMTKSHFGLPDKAVVSHDMDFLRLEGIFHSEEKKEKIVAKVIPRKKKEFERNDVPYTRLSEHIGFLPVVFIAPDDTLIVLEGSEVRRKFLDNTLSQLDPVYLKHLISYNKVLKQRNAALKQFGENHNYNPALIQAYDQQLIPSGNYIHQKRKIFLEEFRSLLLEMQQIISGKAENVDCQYQSNLDKAPFADLLTEAVERDRILQRTTRGIHKDDLEFTIDGYPLKRFASQGQLKTFVLALKLAQYRILERHKKKLPLLLLDDIFDKLDSLRVHQLLQLLLKENFGQIFITDTHENRIEEIAKKFESAYSKFVIENGIAIFKGDKTKPEHYEKKQ